MNANLIPFPNAAKGHPDESYIVEGPDGSRPLDATALEADLRNMWKRVGGGDSTRTGTIYRAALANLVVPLEPALSAKLTPVLVEVTRRHPSRLFTIEPGSLKGTGLRARVGALCHRRESGGGHVCCEQVMVACEAGSTSLIPSAIRSLLIGDLPTVLLDFHPVLGLPWIPELMDMADMVLLDSCIVEESRVVDVWDLIRREGSRKVHDLAWARLIPWRETLAEIFDRKDARAALPTLRRVEIGFTGEGFPPPPAWLLAGWLASRLAWEPEGADRNGLRLRSESGPVTVSLRALGHGEGHVLERIELRSDAPNLLEVEVEHRGRDATATITTRKPAPSRIEVPFGYLELAACIVSEIHRHAANPSLEASTLLAESMMKHASRS